MVSDARAAAAASFFRGFRFIRLHSVSPHVKDKLSRNQETPESSDLLETLFRLSGNKKRFFLGMTPDLISAVFLARGRA